MKKFLFIAVLILPMLLGCGARIMVASNKDTSYQNKLQRIVLVASINNTYLKQELVSQSFVTKLSGHGVPIEIINVNPLELDTNSTVKAAVERQNATQIMTLATTQVISRDHRPVAFTLDCSVFDTATKKRIWRSSIQFSGSEPGADKNADKFVDTIIAKLQSDGLL